MAKQKYYDGTRPISMARLRRRTSLHTDKLLQTTYSNQVSQREVEANENMTHNCSNGHLDCRVHLRHSRLHGSLECSRVHGGSAPSAG